MENRTRQLACAAAAAIFLAAATASAEPGRTIVLHACFGKAPTAMQRVVLERAKAHAADIYAAAGISLVWAADSKPGDGPRSLKLSVALISEVDARELLKANPGLRKTVLGIAPLDSGRVYVFWDRIMSYARNKETLPEQVLGRVLAHEIGHHLLPAQGHSSDGLMRPSLNYRLPQLPAFTAAQVESIRNVLVAAN